MNNLNVILYARQDCPFCERARLVLQRHGISPEIVDIDQDQELAQRYTECVPVVVIDGKERFRGRINEVLLRRLLAHDEPHETRTTWP
jgi:glutaredoxin